MLPVLRVTQGVDVRGEVTCSMPLTFLPTITRRDVYLDIYSLVLGVTGLINYPLGRNVIFILKMFQIFRVKIV